MESFWFRYGANYRNSQDDLDCIIRKFGKIILLFFSVYETHILNLKGASSLVKRNLGKDSGRELEIRKDCCPQVTSQFVFPVQMPPCWLWRWSRCMTLHWEVLRVMNDSFSFELPSLFSVCLVHSSWFLFDAQGFFSRHSVGLPHRYLVPGENPQSPGRYVFFPDAGGLEKAGTAIHEYLGMVWAKLRSQI